MYCLYAPVVSSKGSKRDQYRMSNSEIACTHYLRVYNGQSSVSSSVVNTTWYSLPALGKYSVLSPVRGGGFSQFPSRQHPDQPDWPGTIACRIDWGFIGRTTTVEQIRKRPTNTSHHFPSRYSNTHKMDIGLLSAGTAVKLQCSWRQSCHLEWCSSTPPGLSIAGVPYRHWWSEERRPDPYIFAKLYFQVALGKIKL